MCVFVFVHADAAYPQMDVETVASLRTETFRGDVSDKVNGCWLCVRCFFHRAVLIKASFHNVLCGLGWVRNQIWYMLFSYIKIYIL